MSADTVFVIHRLEELPMLPKLQARGPGDREAWPAINYTAFPVFSNNLMSIPICLPPVYVKVRSWNNPCKKVSACRKKRGIESVLFLSCALQRYGIYLISAKVFQSFFTKKFFFLSFFRINSYLCSVF